MLTTVPVRDLVVDGLTALAVFGAVLVYGLVVLAIGRWLKWCEVR